MSLAPGTQIGPYQIANAIGAGGMGEVFRARDTKLNRDVAIKVLPAAFADDPERLARFTREAQTLASLNHPNIAAIYGIEEVASSASSDGLVAMTKGTAAQPTVTTVALVMELVEGEDLSAHIARGPIPIAEALPIARQIAEALEAAHDQGIVHRDLKPANIKVRTDGMVKVLDFGLAKAMDPAGSSSSNPNVSHSPTLTHQGTSAGMIIGTAAYMSPEQAKGKTVERRTDIWAFGVVLYEMLTGSRLFAAEDVSETLAAVLTRDVNLKALPPGTPVRLRALVSDCLVRDPKQRLRDIGHARIEIARIEAGAPDSAVPTPPALAAGDATVWRRTLPWALLAAALVALAALLTMSGRHRDAPPRRPMDSARLAVNLGVEASREPTGRTLAIAPDASMLAFVGRVESVERLYLRRMDDLTPVALAGTEDARHPFFSPDGRWLGFFADSKLKKIAIQGGEVTTLADAPIGRGGSWGDDDNIYFTPTVRSGIARVPSDGGAVTLVTDPSKGGDLTDRWPQILPGSKTLLLTSHSNNWFYEDARIVVASLETGGRQVVVSRGYFGRYVASGHSCT